MPSRMGLAVFAVAKNQVQAVDDAARKTERELSIL